MSPNCVCLQHQVARDTEQSTQRIGGAWSAAVTGGNSSHITNQPAKKKKDRVLGKYFFAGTSAAN
jgi:hypothetical protein